jgi:hypothetical protein
MKYTEEQKRFLKQEGISGFTNYFKEKRTEHKQKKIQTMIDNHYPVPEKFEILPSKMNKQ